MLTLRADPWMPEYGMGLDIRFDEPPADVDPFVETDDWSVPRPAARPSGPAHFVDGVRRIEVRVIADVDGQRVGGLFGSYATGSALCDSSATFGEPETGRALVLGGGAKGEPIDVRVGGMRLAFTPATTPGTDPDDPLLKLQGLMRDSESAVASRLARAGADLVVVDGPLAFYGETPGPVVGLVKRFGRVYLDAQHAALIAALPAGRRTPLFAIAGPSDVRRRYAWYARLADARAPWHDQAGVVRCEVRGAMPLAEAAALADRVSALLPAYAGRASDPRTPQNLVPVAGLETWLRHRLGDTRLIRRALLDAIARTAEAA